MDRNKLILLFHTIKYLKFKQVYFRVFYLIRNKFFKKTYQKQLQTIVSPLVWNHMFLNSNSYKSENTFTFLNIAHKFDNEIDWNYSEFGKLWTYNLNYFDFLNQEELTIKEGLALIEDYIQNDLQLKDGKEPYPISLRGINWIKFLSKNSVKENSIDQTLHNHYQILLHNLEFHLLGNHLLENGYSLLFGAYYFKDEVLYEQGKKIIIQELKEEILKDGAHFELSPMYHQILLYRLMDCINLIKLNNWKHDNLLAFLLQKAKEMLSWLQNVTYINGNIPMVNDSAFDIAPSSSELFKYAETLGLIWENIPLSDSGYRKFKQNDYELFVDVGNIGPVYQSGHAHADTFSFELYHKGQPIIVDTGISTYENNETRRFQRSTNSHNTIVINQCDQSQMWGAFRVANRAKIINLYEKIDFIQASHDGYKDLGVIHTRHFKMQENNIIIKDILSKNTTLSELAYLHLHPNINTVEIKDNQVLILNENIIIKFANTKTISEESYNYAIGFNKVKEAIKIVISFNTWLEMEVCLNPK